VTPFRLRNHWRAAVAPSSRQAGARHYRPAGT
jgi:hypothetical protein